MVDPLPVGIDRDGCYTRYLQAQAAPGAGHLQYPSWSVTYENSDPGWVVGPAGVRATLAANGAAGYSADMTVWQYAQLGAC